MVHIILILGLILVEGGGNSVGRTIEGFAHQVPFLVQQRPQQMPQGSLICMAALLGRREVGTAWACGGTTKECAHTLHRAHHGLLAWEPHRESFQQAAPEMGPLQVPE